MQLSRDDIIGEIDEAFREGVWPEGLELQSPYFDPTESDLHSAAAEYGKYTRWQDVPSDVYMEHALLWLVPAAKAFYLPGAIRCALVTCGNDDDQHVGCMRNVVIQLAVRGSPSSLEAHRKAMRDVLNHWTLQQLMSVSHALEFLGEFSPIPSHRGSFSVAQALLREAITELQ